MSQGCELSGSYNVSQCVTSFRCSKKQTARYRNLRTRSSVASTYTCARVLCQEIHTVIITLTPQDAEFSTRPEQPPDWMLLLAASVYVSRKAVISDGEQLQQISQPHLCVRSAHKDEHLVHTGADLCVYHRSRLREPWNRLVICCSQQMRLFYIRTVS